MPFTLSNQTATFLWSVALGAALGAFYDIFRILRLAFKTPKWGVFVQDMLYFFAAAAFTFFFILEHNYGSMRGFILIGEISGWLLYYATAGMIVIKTAKSTIFLVKSFCRILFSPFFKVYRFFRRKIKPENTTQP